MSQPNLVLITCDQLRADTLGCAGHPVVQTPHIDLLARRGVRFTQAYSTTPVCVPARAIIMTGLDGHHLGNTGGKPGFQIPVRQTLPRLLSDAGYHTQVVGKMHVYPERCHYGFHSMLLWEEGRPFGKSGGRHRGYGDYEDWLAEQGYPGQAFGHGMANNAYSMTPWHLPDRLHPTEWIGTESCRAIKRRDWTRPLFLWASFTAPHPPLTPLLRDLYAYDQVPMPTPVMGDWTARHPLFHRKKIAQFSGETMTAMRQQLAYRAYYASVTHVDRQINRIIGTLREEGMLDNTWLIFTADHGDNLGDHGLWAKSNFLRGACNIPLVVAPPLRGDPDEHVAPGWMPGGTASAVVGLQDLLPTLAELAGTEAQERVDGASLLPIVRKTDESLRSFIVGEFGVIGARSLMVTDGKWKYIWYEQDGRELLFDIADDPDEMRDLASLRPDVRATYVDKLVQTLAARDGDPALRDGQLRPAEPGRQLSALELARLPNDRLPRGLH